jgi:hypothetical protein
MRSGSNVGSNYKGDLDYRVAEGLNFLGAGGRPQPYFCSTAYEVPCSKLVAEIL